jgi:hypothetical protein
MTLTQLRTPILDGGIKSINFFNGRLLSGEDLSQEKAANKQARQQLGQTSGDGIAYGLEVKETSGQSTKQSPIVTVNAGLALNRLGQTLPLAQAVDVALVRPPADGSTAAVTALFSDCQPLQQGPYVVGKGVYLLTIQPAVGTNGKAPVSGLGNLDAACNARYQIDGVQFRLIQLPITAGDLNDVAHLRNRLAYRCFGATDDEVVAFMANPFGPVVTRYGLLDDLRPDCLKDDEVPLALIFWTAADGLKFVDLWSVRRRITRRSADTDWPLLVSDRRAAEGEAMFLQFQDQIEEMRVKETGLSAVVATDRFDYLPPVGLLPVKGTGSPGGFDVTTFFGARASQDIALTDANLVRELLHTASYHEPIDLQASDKIQLYLTYENVKAVEAQQVNQATLVFASHTLPYRGIARFGYARWAVSRFAPRVI